MFHPNATNNPPCVPTIKPVHKSEFLGSVGGYIGTCIKAYLANMLVVLFCVVFCVSVTLALIASCSQQALLPFLLIMLVCLPCAFFSCWGGAWAFLIRCRWDARHTIISGHPVCFEANTTATAITFMKWGFLSIITCGIYSLWLPILLRKWKCAHFYVDPYVKFVDVDHSNCEHNQVNILNKSK